MYYHVLDGNNAWSKFNGHRCYSYRAKKHPPIIMYGIKSLVTVSMETKRGMKHLTCDCTSHHGTRPVCKVSDLYIPFTVFELQESKLN